MRERILHAHRLGVCYFSEKLLLSRLKFYSTASRNFQIFAQRPNHPRKAANFTWLVWQSNIRFPYPTPLGNRESSQKWNKYVTFEFQVVKNISGSSINEASQLTRGEHIAYEIKQMPSVKGKLERYSNLFEWGEKLNLWTLLSIPRWGFYENWIRRR